MTLSYLPWVLGECLASSKDVSYEENVVHERVWCVVVCCVYCVCGVCFVCVSSHPQVGELQGGKG